jgi:hypothetical protein
LIAKVSVVLAFALLVVAQPSAAVSFFFSFSSGLDSSNAAGNRWESTF